MRAVPNSVRSKRFGFHLEEEIATILREYNANKWRPHLLMYDTLKT